MAAASIAWAAFSYSPTAQANGNTATFQSVTMTAQWLDGDNGPLIPGDNGDVKLLVNVPGANNVNAKIVSITGVPIAAADISGAATTDAAANCATWLERKTFSPAGIVLQPGASNLPLILDNAIKLSSDATNDCQGITFVTRWTVQFDATHDAVTSPSGGTIS
jgi:hypothetical protein